MLTTITGDEMGLVSQKLSMHSLLTSSGQNTSNDCISRTPSRPWHMGSLSHRLALERAAQLDQRIQQIRALYSRVHVSRLTRRACGDAQDRTSPPGQRQWREAKKTITSQRFEAKVYSHRCGPEGVD